MLTPGNTGYHTEWKKKGEGTGNTQRGLHHTEEEYVYACVYIQFSVLALYYPGNHSESSAILTTTPSIFYLYLMLLNIYWIKTCFNLLFSRTFEHDVGGGVGASHAISSLFNICCLKHLS